MVYKHKNIKKIFDKMKDLELLLEYTNLKQELDQNDYFYFIEKNKIFN